MLYEPYTNSCGHTFCYSCLSQWFNNAEHKKSCPDCRATIKHAPAPAYVVRDMTQKFISHPHLLPEGETAEQHEKWRQEEAEVVERDKMNVEGGGLFKGCFRERARTQSALRDVEDGVDRCPHCAWEMEDQTFCIHCGYDVYNSGTSESDSSDDEDDVPPAPPLSLRGPSWTDEDSDEEDLDGDLDEEDHDVEDGFANWNHPDMEGSFPGFSDEEGSDASMTDAYDEAPLNATTSAMRQFASLARGLRDHRHHDMFTHPMPHQNQPSTGWGPAGGGDEHSGSDESEEEGDSVEDDDEDGEEDDSEDDSVMNDFIDDDVGEEDSDDSDGSNSTPRQISPPVRRHARPQVLDSEDEAESDVEGQPAQVTRASTRSGTLTDASQEDEDEESDSDEGGGVSNGLRRR